MNPQDNDPIPDIDVNLDDQPAPKQYHSAGPNRKRKSHGGSRAKIIIIIVASVLFLAAGAFAVYWFVLKKDDAPTVSEQSTQPANDSDAEDQQPELSPSEASELKTFKSEALALEFDHRADWTVEESDDGNSITLTSPNISYQTINGTVPEGRGVFTLKIAKGVNSAQRDAINAAVAVEKSEVIAYAKPTEVQRHYTSISYGGQEDAFTFMMVTGAVEFAKGDPWANKLTLSSADYYLIAGGFGEDPDNALAFDQVATSQITSQSVKQAIAIIESMHIN